MTELICMHCKKPIKGWGIDGCPSVKKGAEPGLLFGLTDGYIHYDCIKNDKTNDRT